MPTFLGGTTKLNVAMKTIKNEHEDYVAVADGFPTIKDEDRKHIATPANVDGFPTGWTARRIPSASGASVSTIFYSPIKKLRLTSKKDVHIFLDCLKRADGNEVTASHYFMQDKAMNQTPNTRKRKLCTHDLCNKQAVFGGKCRRHGPRCATYNCGLAIYARGHCKKHDPGPPDANKLDANNKKRKLSPQPQKKKSFPRSELFTRALSCDTTAFTPIKIGSRDLLQSEGGKGKRWETIQPIANKINNANPRPKQTSTGSRGGHIKFEETNLEETNLEDHVCDKKRGTEEVQYHRHKHFIADNAVSDNYINESKAAQKIVVKEKMTETDNAKIGGKSNTFDNKEEDTKVTLTADMKSRIISYVSKEGEKGARAKHMKAGIEGFHDSCKGLNAHDVLQDNLSNELQLKCIKHKKRYFLIESSTKRLDESKVANIDAQKGTQSGLVAALESDAADINEKGGETMVILTDDVKSRIVSYVSTKGQKGARAKHMKDEIDGFHESCKGLNAHDVLQTNLSNKLLSKCIKDKKRYFLIDSARKDLSEDDGNAVKDTNGQKDTQSGTDAALESDVKQTDSTIENKRKEERIKLHHHQARKAKFPIGCQVITFSSDVSISIGVVTSVSISMTDGKLFYQIKKSADTSTTTKNDLIGESLLAFAPMTPVYIQLSQNQARTKGKVLDPVRDCSGLLRYSVMMATADNGEHTIYRNVKAEQIFFRYEKVSSKDSPNNGKTDMVAVTPEKLPKLSKWRSTRVENDNEHNMIARDGRYWYWCEDCGGMYCMHKPGKAHKEWQKWQQRKEEGLMERYKDDNNSIPSKEEEGKDNHTRDTSDGQNVVAVAKPRRDKRPKKRQSRTQKWQQRKQEGLIKAVSDSQDVMMDDNNSIKPSEEEDKLKQSKGPHSRETSDEHNVVAVTKPRRDKRPKKRQRGSKQEKQRKAGERRKLDPHSKDTSDEHTVTKPRRDRRPKKRKMGSKQEKPVKAS